LDTRGFFFHPQLSVVTFFALVLQVFRNRFHCHGDSVPEPTTSILSTLALSPEKVVAVSKGTAPLHGREKCVRNHENNTHESLDMADVVERLK
jgi:hypothetical protein